MSTQQINDSIDEPSLGYNEMVQSWELPRALLGGTHQMRKEGRKYLPQFPLESDAAYSDRLNTSVLFNAFAKAVYGLTGKVFAKPIQLGENTPPEIEVIYENVDLTGRHLNVFGRDVFVDALSYGLSHILIDMPVNTAETRADEKAMNIRPYWVHVKAQQLIGWRAKLVNGVYMLTQVRIKESYLAEAGLYAEIEVDRIRVLTPGAYEIWDAIGEKGEYIKVDEGTTSLNFIPLITVYAKRKSFMIGEPPLEDLAHLNAQHWQSESDQFHITHVARVPLLHFAGFGEDFKVADAGPHNAFKGPSDSKMSYCEIAGASLQAGREQGNDLVERMQILAMEPLIPRPGTQTATEKAINTAEAHSELQAMAINLQDGLELAAQVTAIWLGLGEDAGGEIKVNTDYGISLRDGKDLEILSAARIRGDLSRETFWDEMERRGVLMDGFDPETEAQRINDEAPTLMPPTTPPVDPNAADKVNGDDASKDALDGLDE